jgi:hypothetical protein
VLVLALNERYTAEHAAFVAEGVQAAVAAVCGNGAS